ncbi:cathepsin L-like proteinase [Diorhabda carinulata]|uniref:cathepsin L-like proteinase n=1 Tax=Diorhabda carinulata TaxID=1163345 RepID=UPI0025A0009D|nr:cathepsin L-like proteinase [Diorhabda carinulata]
MISKIILIFFVSVVVVYALTEQEQFEEFKKSFNKHYTPEEEPQRFKNFQNSLKRIAEQNKKFAEGKSTHSAGINQFSDLSEQEWSQRNHGLRPHGHQHGN